MTEQTTETPRRKGFKSRTAANVARNTDYQNAVKAADEAYVAAVTEFLALVEDRLTDCGKKLRKIAALHMPDVPSVEFIYPKRLSCPKCNDNASYDAERDPFPCETMAVIVKDLDLPDAPVLERPTMPDLADYWPDPCVTVTFAYLTVITDKETGYKWLLNPGDQPTLKHSLAYELRQRLVTTSRQRVESMA